MELTYPNLSIDIFAYFPKYSYEGDKEESKGIIKSNN